MKPVALTVLSNGGGQDTTYLIHRLLHDAAFRAAHVQGRLVIAGSDTGDEHEHTYANIRIVNALCKEMGAEAYWITPEMGYHSEAWKTLTTQYKRNKTIGSAAFRQTCTDNLKVKVVDNFIETWIAENYYQGRKLPRKKIYHEFYRDHGSIRLLLGFAKGEEARIANGNKHDAVWKKKCVVRHNPLIIEGIGRQDCIDYNARHFTHKVYPSNCKRCFYQSEQELLWLFRNDPVAFWEWVDMEQSKLDKNAGVPKNYGVYTTMTLLQKIVRAQKLYGHWTAEELDEYKFSHGHCIKSKY